MAQANCSLTVPLNETPDPSLGVHMHEFQCLACSDSSFSKLLCTLAPFTPEIEIRQRYIV